MGITKTTSFETEGKAVEARRLDFVTRFGANWELLMNLYGIMRPIEKAPGTRLRTHKAVMKDSALQTSPAEGVNITPTEFGVEEILLDDLTVEKYKKTTTVEAVEKYGAEIAIQKTDDEFLNQLQFGVQNKFYTFLKTGTLAGKAQTIQSALALAKGAVLEKFADMQKTVTEVVGFANIYEVYDALGDATLSTQTLFGLTYVENFLGYKTLFLVPDKILQNKVIATPVENLVCYFTNPSNSDFAKLGLNYTVDGETPLIGFATQGNYDNATGSAYALMGIRLLCEYIDGICVMDYASTETKTKPTVASGSAKGMKSDKPTE